MKWTMDMKKRFASEIPFWYTGQCPLIDGDVLVLAPAGKDTLMLGVDVKTGNTVWGTPNSVNFKMSHSSVIPMTLSGTRTYVYIGVGGVCGVSAEGAMGKMLWSASKWQPSVVAPSPLQISQNQVFLVAGYGAGGALLQVGKSGANWSAEIKDSYYNMREKIEPVMNVLHLAEQAMELAGVKPVIKPIRGGTDGARLSFMGLPCPNICTGGRNYHGRFEYCCSEDMETISRILVRLISAF